MKDNILNRIRSIIALIMQHYLTYYARKFGKDNIALTPGAAARAAAYGWPGNIREIRNVSEQLSVLCDSDAVTAADLDDVLPREPRQAGAPESEPASAGGASLSSLERRRIQEVLASAPSRAEAARILGISKTTLWRRCKELGV